MTAPTNAVAKRQLSPQQQAIVDERLQSHLVQQIRGATWGKEWNADTIAAVATWAREQDVDPITEIDVLGGNIYIKARRYERVLSQLIAAGVIEYARKDWVHVDKRLEKLADSGDAEAKAESLRRMKARIANNLSDEATAACVYRIKHRLMDQEVTGAKEYNPAGRADPVGKSHPTETIETRALRRAMLQLSEAMPDVRMPTTNDDSMIGVAEIVKGSYEQLKQERSQRMLTPCTSTLDTADEVQSRAEPVMTSRVPAGLEEEDDELTDADIDALDRQREGQGGLGIDDRKPARSRSAQSQGR